MKKIIIIGAGPAGLSAGLELLRREKMDVTIIEESSYIGGISRTVNAGEFRMDMGGHRFFSKIPRVNKFWDELMPQQGYKSIDDIMLGRESRLSKGGPDPNMCDDVMLIRKRVSRIYYNKKFFDYPISLKLSTIKNMGILNTFISMLSYIKSCISKMPENNLENFYINRFGKKLYSMFFKDYTKKVWGREPSKISATWGAQRVKGLSIIKLIKNKLNQILHIKGDVETSLIEEFSYPKYGPGKLWEKACQEFMKLGGKVIQNAKVNNILIEDNKVTGVEYIMNDNVYSKECDILISSMPLKDLINSMEVPKNIKEIANNLPYRDFVTIGMLLRKLNLRNTTKTRCFMDIVPDCWIYIQDKKVKMGRMQIFNNWSPYMLDNPKENVAVGLEYFCDESSKFFNSSDEDKVNFAIKELIKIGAISSKNDVIKTHVEYVKKAYPAYFDSYEHIDEVKNYLNEYSNLYCIGRNGQHRYNNMDHSMMTGFLAADNILSGQEDKSNIWNVNTEGEYHETYESNSRKSASSGS